MQYTFCKNSIQHYFIYLYAVNHQNPFTACCQSDDGFAGCDQIKCICVIVLVAIVCPSMT